MGLTDTLFARICAANPDWRLERTAEGDLVIMPPAGADSSSKNADLTTDLAIWTRQTRLGKCFDSSAGFRLPSGAIRGADASWVRNDQSRRLVRIS